MADSNWTLKKDGWHKKKRSSTKGSAGYFSKSAPIVRDDQGRPMSSDRSSIDIARWIQEVNERDGHHG